jgi:hypothetical protein
LNVSAFLWINGEFAYYDRKRRKLPIGFKSDVECEVEKARSGEDGQTKFGNSHFITRVIPISIKLQLS